MYSNLIKAFTRLTNTPLNVIRVLGLRLVNFVKR